MDIIAAMSQCNQARRARARTAARCRGLAGFTLIEMMIVITIIMILMGMAAGIYTRSVQRAREAVLKDDLQTMRKAIDNYTTDNETAPQALEDLTNPQKQYLREIPTDPITRQRDWHLDYGDIALTPDQSSGAGIIDVHSNSDQVSPFEGTPYNTW